MLPPINVRFHFASDLKIALMILDAYIRALIQLSWMLRFGSITEPVTTCMVVGGRVALRWLTFVLMVLLDTGLLIHHKLGG